MILTLPNVISPEALWYRDVFPDITLRINKWWDIGHTLPQVRISLGPWNVARTSLSENLLVLEDVQRLYYNPIHPSSQQCMDTSAMYGYNTSMNNVFILDELHRRQLIIPCSLLNSLPHIDNHQKFGHNSPQFIKELLMFIITNTLEVYLGYKN